MGNKCFVYKQTGAVLECKEGIALLSIYYHHRFEATIHSLTHDRVAFDLLGISLAGIEVSEIYYRAIGEYMYVTANGVYFGA